jgi:hypothetical protein
MSYEEERAKLEELYQMGFITETEYSSRKALLPSPSPSPSSPSPSPASYSHSPSSTYPPTSPSSPPHVDAVEELERSFLREGDEVRPADSYLLTLIEQLDSRYPHSSHPTSHTSHPYITSYHTSYHTTSTSHPHTSHPHTSHPTIPPFPNPPSPTFHLQFLHTISNTLSP